MSDLPTLGERARAADMGLFDRLFHLRESGSDVRTEVEAGFTTFLTMAYILVVNPQILAEAGVPIEGALFAFELSDTGSAPVAGRSKLQVVHLAESAPPLDVWRTQPDFSEPVRVMFPFPLGAQSSYIESEPGPWSVWATAEGTTTPVLATTGSLNILGGQVWTVLLLDEPGGGFTAVPLQDR